jgi:hypothetical protein
MLGPEFARAKSTTAQDECAGVLVFVVVDDDDEAKSSFGIVQTVCRCKRVSLRLFFFGGERRTHSQKYDSAYKNIMVLVDRDVRAIPIPSPNKKKD